MTDWAQKIRKWDGTSAWIIGMQVVKTKDCVLVLLKHQVLLPQRELAYGTNADGSELKLKYNLWGTYAIKYVCTSLLQTNKELNCVKTT